MEKRDVRNKKIGKIFIPATSGILVLAVLLILLAVGPAKAFILSLDIDDGKVTTVDEVKFKASIKIENGEFLDIDYIVLELRGLKDAECSFYPNSSIIRGCDEFAIVQTSSTSYRYGYGFEKGLLENNITLNTTDYPAGVYKTFLSFVLDERMFKEKGKDILIKRKVGKLKSCSLRAVEGDLKVDSINFGKNNKLSFYIPEQNARNGEGFLSGQKRNDRFSYKFDVKDILENNEKSMTVLVSGVYRLGLSRGIPEDATIVYNKSNKKIDLIVDDITIKNMNVTFKEGC